MRNICRVLFCTCAIILIFSSAFAKPVEKPDASEIVRKMDRLYRSDDSYSEVSMHIVNPNWERTIEMKIWTKGMDKTFVRILSPKKDRGISTLRVGTEMWNYLPKIDKVMKIPPSMMMGSWMGSDFTNDDLVKESSLLEDYNFELMPQRNGQEDSYFIKLLPKEKSAIVWGKIIAKIKKEDYIPVWEEFYDENGKKMRIMNFTDVKNMGGRKIPSRMELVPLTKKKNKTVVVYKKIKFDIGVEDSIFSLRNLREKI